MLFLPSSVRLSLRFSSLAACLATVGWKAPKRHWLAQTSASLVYYLLLPSTSSSLSSPSPSSRARMPEKIFLRRRHPSGRESAAPRIFVLFSSRSSISATADSFPFRSRCPPGIRSTIMKFFIAFRSLSAVRISLSLSSFFLSLHQFDYINIWYRIICNT